MKGCRVGVTSEERVGQCQDRVIEKEGEKERKKEARKTRIGK